MRLQHDLLQADLAPDGLVEHPAIGGLKDVDALGKPEDGEAYASDATDEGVRSEDRALEADGKGLTGAGLAEQKRRLCGGLEGIPEGSADGFDVHQCRDYVPGDTVGGL